MLIDELIKDFELKKITVNSKRKQSTKPKDYYSREERNNYNKWYYENITRRKTKCNN